jgi:hypothetical protein
MYQNLNIPADKTFCQTKLTEEQKTSKRMHILFLLDKYHDAYTVYSIYVKGNAGLSDFYTTISTGSMFEIFIHQFTLKGQSHQIFTAV